jgi:hypothetical protein
MLRFNGRCDGESSGFRAFVVALSRCLQFNEVESRGKRKAK